MTRRQRAGVSLRVAGLALVALTGCSAGVDGAPASGTSGATTPSGSPSTPGTSATSTPSSSPSTVPPARSPHAICSAAFAPGRLLDWTAGTVAEFRAFGYGGPTQIRPLLHAFPGTSASTAGAWCGTLQRPETIRWWAVVPGLPPVKAVDITGDGETVPRGELPQLPRVP